MWPGSRRALSNRCRNRLFAPERLGLGEALPALLRFVPSGLNTTLVPAVHECGGLHQFHSASLTRMFCDPAQYRFGHRRIIQRAEQILQFAQPFEKRRDGLGGKNRREKFRGITQLLEREAQTVALLYI